MVPEGVIESTGHAAQTADVVARSVLALMSNTAHNGHVIMSSEGEYWEMEETLLSAADTLGSLRNTDRIMDGIEALSQQGAVGTGGIPGSSS